MSIIKHYGTGLFSLGNLTTLVANLTKRVKDLENTPSGNGIYGSSDTIPLSTLATVTEDPTGNVMDFAIGNFPSWPDFDYGGNDERGFYYGNAYQNGVGLINDDVKLNLSSSTINMQVPGFSFSLGSTGVTAGLTGSSRNIVWGEGDPNGVVTARGGSIYLNTLAGTGTTFWVKETVANSNTGWVAK